MLDGPLLLAPLTIAALLVTSGIAKVRAPAETRSAFQQLRLPRVLADGPAPTVLPWAEIALAIALLVLPGRWALIPAVVALGLMLTYLAIIVRALGFGYPVTCSCFGRLGLGLVTRRTMWRNAALVVVAGVGLLAAGGERSVLARLLSAPATVWLWLALTALVGLVLVLTFGGGSDDPDSVVAPSASGDGLDEEWVDYQRQPLPHGVLVTAEGRTRNLYELVGGGAHLLVFLSIGCGPCESVIPRIREWDEEFGPVTVRAVVTDSVEGASERAPLLAGVVLHDPSGLTRRVFAAASPGAVLLGMDGLLAGGPVAGSARIEEMVQEIRESLAEADLDVAPDDDTESDADTAPDRNTLPAPDGDTAPTLDDELGNTDQQRSEA